MSRPRKIHRPLVGGFNNILAAIADGKGVKPAAKTGRIKKTTPKKK